MVAGCGAKMSKMILFIFNFLVWLVGIVLIGLGGYVLARVDTFADFFGPNTNTLAVVSGVVIGVGCLIFLLAFCGCCGAIKESSCLLKVYFAVLLLLLLLEIVGGILALVYRGDIERVLKEELYAYVKNTYVQPDDIKTKEGNAMDILQQGEDCCGSNNYTDYVDSKFQTDNPGSFVPISCCRDKKKDGCNAGKNGNTEIANEGDIYQTGCITALKNTLESYLLIIGAVALAMIVAEILAMIFACCVISGIDKGDYE